MTTVDVIKTIVKDHPEIKQILLVSYKPAKDLVFDYRYDWTVNDQIAYKEALKLRREYRLPFWHALMLSIINSEDGNLPINCLLGTSRHHKVTEREEIDRHNIDVLEDYQYHTVRTGVSSTVKMANGTIRHIPMLDFHISLSRRNTFLVTEVCRLLGYHGFILYSGKSYHFIGNTLVTKSEMINYLGRALLFTPIVDTVWIAHQLQDQTCTLRISSKHGVFPEVIESI